MVVEYLYGLAHHLHAGMLAHAAGGESHSVVLDLDAGHGLLACHADVEQSGRVGLERAQSVLDGVFGEYLYHHGWQPHAVGIHIGCHVGGVAEVVAHLLGFDVDVVAHKLHLLVEGAHECVGTLHASAQQLGEGVEVDLVSVHLGEHLVVERVVDEVGRYAVAGVLHAQLQHLLACLHLAHLSASAQQHDGEAHGEDDHYGEEEESPCQCAEIALVVYDVLLLGYLLVVAVSEHIGIHTHLDVGGLQRVVDGVHLSVGGVGFVVSAHLLEHILLGLEPLHDGGGYHVLWRVALAGYAQRQGVMAFEHGDVHLRGVGVVEADVKAHLAEEAVGLVYGGFGGRCLAQTGIGLAQVGLHGVVVPLSLGVVLDQLGSLEEVGQSPSVVVLQIIVIAPVVVVDEAVALLHVG